MIKYMLMHNRNLFAFSKKYGFTAKYQNKKWEPSNISYMALLAEKDDNFVEIISEDEALILTSGNNSEEYFEKLNAKLNNIPGRR